MIDSSTTEAMSGEYLFYYSLVTVLVPGIILHILTRVWDKIGEKKRGIRNYNGTFTNSSFALYMQLVFLVLIGYFFVAIYTFLGLAKDLGEYYPVAFIVYAFTVAGFAIAFTNLIADNPLHFEDKKCRQGGTGLICGTVICEGGIFSAIGIPLCRNEVSKAVIGSFVVACFLGLILTYIIAIEKLDGSKKYRNQWIALYLNNKKVEDKILSGTIKSKGEWIQYKCKTKKQIVEKAMKKDSFDKIKYYNKEEKKKLVQINTVCNASTGRIMHDIQKCAKEAGWDTLSLVGRRKVYTDLPCERYGSGVSFWLHVIITTLFDRQGHGSLLHTKRLVARLREENPDVIHLHNLHGYYLHIPTLFKYLKEEYKGKIFWTFHDLWPITGHCPYFVVAECDKWKNECKKCPNKRLYPISWGLDQSRRNFREKRDLFTGLNHLEIVAPSQWVAEQVKESFLKDVPVHVVPNGIDLECFQYTYDESVYEKYNIPKDKKVILGVASVWEKRKGLYDFLELAKSISKEYVVVLVGLSQRQKKKLSGVENIIGIRRTENKKELAMLYSRADVLLNPSKEETFSLVTVEAMACGTPVIGMDTSAVKELINSKNGVLLHDNYVNDYVTAIECLEQTKLDKAVVRDTILKYSEGTMAERIIKLYEAAIN